MEMNDMKFGVELVANDILGQLCGVEHNLWRR